jgi:8-oxo-dGTP pyrophosphatase MutT (NUDIX family)
MCAVTISRVAASLAASCPEVIERDRPSREAAVAAVLRESGPVTELLFIHRAEDPDDPWSGHMAFPGGRVESNDRDALAAAVRETREEVAIDLERHGRLLGRLSDVVAMARGQRLDMVIVPFVFELRRDLELRPNSEVQDAIWVPVEVLSDPRYQSTIPWRYGSSDLELPCVRYAGRVIWGLTHRMVVELLRVIA